MKITKTLLIPALLLLLVAGCGEANEKTTACSCISYEKTNAGSTDPALGFYEAYMITELGDFINGIYLDSVNFQVDSIAKDAPGRKTRSEFGNKFWFNISEDYQLMKDPRIGFSKGKDTARINKILDFHLKENWLGENNIKFIWSIDADRYLNAKTPHYVLYALRTEYDNSQPRITSKVVASAALETDPNNYGTSILVKMTPEGTTKWAQMTTENVRKFVAITYHNKVLSAPQIMSPITGGQIMISGNLNKQKAKGLVNVINCEAHQQKVGQEAFEKEIAKCSEKN